MADFIGGIKRIGPSYPMRPVQPPKKDRKANDEQEKHEKSGQKDPGDDEQPHIDELA